MLLTYSDQINPKVFNCLYSDRLGYNNVCRLSDNTFRSRTTELSHRSEPVVWNLFFEGGSK